MLNQRLFNMAKIKFGRINQIYLVCCYYCSNQNNTSPKCVHLNIFIWDFMAFSIQNIQNCQESINWYFFLLKAIKSFFVNKLAISPSGYSGRNSYLCNFLGLFFGRFSPFLRGKKMASLRVENLRKYRLGPAKSSKSMLCSMHSSK